jgi:hypothetical protein
VIGGRLAVDQLAQLRFGCAPVVPEVDPLALDQGLVGGRSLPVPHIHVLRQRAIGLASWSCHDFLYSAAQFGSPALAATLATWLPIRPR